ncbi:MAG TPA: ISAzo13 family transposase, partial [Gammaproteobacteria bacterium]|nr:ISAzo13 family transposase [Gammaproteobacteria bacterium]
PPGTSKWNKIEHRLFSFISLNWRGKPLTSYQVIINLIASTTTKTGLTVKARLDEKLYTKGKKVTDQEMKSLKLLKNKFHGEWNYTIKPRKL